MNIIRSKIEDTVEELCRNFFLGLKEGQIIDIPNLSGQPNISFKRSPEKYMKIFHLMEILYENSKSRPFKLSFSQLYHVSLARLKIYKSKRFILLHEGALFFAKRLQQALD